MSFLPLLVSVITIFIGTTDSATSQSPAAEKRPGEEGRIRHTDAHGDPLPPGAIARLGGIRLQHGGAVSNLVFTRDGKELISAGGEGTIRMWDSKTGREIRHFSGHEAPVYSIAVSPDGKILASGGEDQTIRLWDVAGGKALRHWSVSENARLCVAFSPNGRTLCSGGKDNSIVLWDVNTGNELRRFGGRQRREDRWGRSEGGSLFSLAFAPDGRYILTAQSDGLVLWDVETGKRVRRYEDRQSGGWRVGNGRMSVSSSDVNKSISFSADGQKFVMPSDHDGQISLWELNSVEEYGRFGGHQNVVLAARFSPDGKTLGSAGFDGTLRIWDPNTLKELNKIEIGSDLITELAISPTGETLAGGTVRGRIRLWDLKTGKEQAAAERVDEVLSIGFTPDGRSVVSLHPHAIRHWDAAGGKEVGKTDLAQEKEPALMQLSSDRRLLVQARRGQPIRILDATTGKEIRALEGKPDHVLQLALSSDGKTTAAVTVDGDPDENGTSIIRLWDATTGKETQQFPARQVLATALALTPDSRMIAGTELFGGVRLWELATAKERRRFAMPNNTGRFSEDWMEMRFAVRRMRARRDDEGAESAGPVVFTPDGRGLAICQGETIRVWDLAGGNVVRRYTCDAGIKSEFAFSSDGRFLAAGGPDDTIWIWNTAGAELSARLTGHRGSIRRLAFSSDNKHLVSAGEDGTAIVWDVRAAIAAPQAQALADPVNESTAALWADLAGDEAARAFSAVQKLVAAPSHSVRLLRDRLRPAAPVDPHQIARLIDELDDSMFAVREQATNELERLHELVAPALDKALAAAPPPEAQRRLERLVQKLKQRRLPPNTVRALRAVEVLEHIGSAEARQLLESLSKGVPEAHLTHEAKIALERLDNRAPNKAKRN